MKKYLMQSAVTATSNAKFIYHGWDKNNEQHRRDNEFTFKWQII